MGRCEPRARVEQLPSGLGASGPQRRRTTAEAVGPEADESYSPSDRLPLAAARIPDGKTRVDLGDQEEATAHVQARQWGAGPSQAWSAITGFCYYDFFFHFYTVFFFTIYVYVVALLSLLIRKWRSRPQWSCPQGQHTVVVTATVTVLCVEGTRSPSAVCRPTTCRDAYGCPVTGTQPVGQSHATKVTSPHSFQMAWPFEKTKNLPEHELFLTSLSCTSNSERLLISLLLNLHFLILSGSRHRLPFISLQTVVGALH